MELTTPVSPSLSVVTVEMTFSICALSLFRMIGPALFIPAFT
jgi:hypothetical protein